MSILVDTNILLRIAQILSPDRPLAKSAILALIESHVRLCVVPQVIYEFWVVATRPISVNGLGMDPTTAEQSLQGILRDYELLKDERGVFVHWHALVTYHAVCGKTAHDARLVAAMKRHRLTNLLTFNAPDFTRFSDIRVFAPSDILAGQIPHEESSQPQIE